MAHALAVRGSECLEEDVTLLLLDVLPGYIQLSVAEDLSANE